MDSMRGRGPSLRHRRANRSPIAGPQRRPRALHLEKFEERALMAIGAGQVGITLPDGTALVNNAQLHVAPREIDFEFAPNVQVDPNSLGAIQLVRSGRDGTFGDANDVTVAAGFLGIGDKPNTLVYRFANTPLDDFYRLNIVTAGAGALRDKAGAPLVVTPAQLDFRVDTGAQIVAVVPQPITRGAGGVLEQARDTIEVYFNSDDLQPNDLGVKNKDFYQLIFTAGSGTTADDVVYQPTLVSYDADADKAVLKFAAPIDELGSGAGIFRLRIGNDDQPLPAPVLLPQAQDAGDTFGTSKDLGQLGASAQIVSAEISPNRLGGTPYNLPFPGGEDEPGHRDNPVQTHIFGSDTSEGTDTVTFNFPRIYGSDRFGLPLFNLVSEAQKQRTREIFAIYANYLGIQVAEVESDAQGAASIGVVTGDVRAVGLPPFGPAGVSTGSQIIMNATVNWGESEYGGGWFTTAMHEVGHSLGLGHSYELPGAIQGGGPLAGDPLFPGTYDLVHGLHVHRPDSIDVDLYKFEVPAGAGQGRLTAEILAERQDNASLLDSVLSLWALNPESGKYELVSRNDDYFGADSFVAMDLAPGTYYLGVSSTGNINYDPNMSASGVGGRSQGKYDLRLEFTPAHTNSLKDTAGTEIDGDADGQPGGTFNFWFRANTPANTLVVDKIPGPGAGPLGSLTNPFGTLDQALATALPGQIVRVVGNGGADGNVATGLDNEPYLIGLDDEFNILPDGENVEIPRGVTLMIDAGAVLKLQRAPISVGSFVQGYDISGGALQVLGTPASQVYFTSLHDETIGLGDDTPTGRLPNRGDWAGIALHTDIDRLVNHDLDLHPNPNVARRTDYERDGIFLNVINSAVVTYAGGLAVRRGLEEKFAPIELHQSRPTLTYNTIVDNADAAISADPDSFEESRFWGRTYSADYDRVGPDVRGNNLEVKQAGGPTRSNTINGLFVDVSTGTVPGTTQKVTLSTRWDDTDIVHVVGENLFIAGGEGGPLNAGGRMAPRPNGRLAIDPNIVVKLGGSRIEAEIGGQLIAEGQLGSPVVFTSIIDDRYGAGGTFDTNADDAALNFEGQPAAGDWAGLYFGPSSKGSLDYVRLMYAGGAATIEGTTDLFNAVELHQAEFRMAHSLLQNNAAGFAAGGRNGRGDNDPATLWAIGSQPVLVGNTVRDNEAAALSFDVNSFSNRPLVDYGRTTGRIDALREQADNVGPFLRNNRLGNNAINGLQVRGGTVVNQSVWDDTDVVHVVQSEIVVPNFHTNTGLRLQSTASESLVVKLSGDTAGLTAGGNGLDIDDRIGGTLQIIGNAAFPVVLTSLADDTAGAGQDLDGGVQRDTNNDGLSTGTTPNSLPTPTGPALAVNVTTTASTLVNAMLLTPLPAGVSITSSAYTGGANAAGVYTNGASIPLFIPGAGVLLTTGDAELPASNTSDGFSDIMNVAGDADLDALIANTGVTTDEASVLTITFNVTDPSIKSGTFRFQFGSEEFSEFVNSDYNDVVGAFINGGAATNFLRDSQGELISINSAFFDIDNENAPYKLSAEYDGMTVGLLAAFPVVQGTNTLKIAIGDASDSVLDSGIFMTDLKFSNSEVGSGGVTSEAGEGDWRSILFGPNANDRNVGTYNELEDADYLGADTNNTLNRAQYLGELAANEKAGDDSRRLGLEAYGSIRAGAPNDVDIFMFRGVPGSEVWIDIDNTSQRLDSVVELLNASGQRVAISQDSVKELLGQDLYSVNPRDAGMRVALPGVPGTVTTYFLRVQSNGPSVSTGFTGEQTTGQYRLNVRLRAQDEISGSTVRNADIRFATNGIETRGMPRHSPLVVDSGDAYQLNPQTGAVVGVANNSIDTAVNLGNLLGSDRSALTVAGGLFSPTAVNWYKFSVRYQDIQEIAGVNGGRKNWSTIFDIDWADGLGRPDTQISVFQQIDSNAITGDPILTPVLLGRDSNIADDQASGALDDLSRGTFGSQDAFIGPAILPAGGTSPTNPDPNASLTYYVAVHSTATLPLALAGYFTRHFESILQEPNDPRKLFRLEPVSSVRRVVEDHIGSVGFGSGDEGGVLVNPTTGPILKVDSAISLRTHVRPFELSDVTLYVAQGGAQQRLITIDPQTGAQETSVGTIGSAARPVGDIALRSDGALYAYREVNTVGEFETNAGELSQLNPGTGAVTVIGLDGIGDDAEAELTDGVDDLETVTNFGVGAVAFRRFDINAFNDINDHYLPYYAVDNNGFFNNGTSRLFLADPDSGTAVPSPNDPWGARGDILEFVQGDLFARVGDEDNPSPNILENDGANAQVVTLTRPAHTLTFPLTATVSFSSVDGSPLRAVPDVTQVTFAAGEQTATVNINTIDDDAANGTQSILVMATGFDPVYGGQLNSVGDRLNVLDDEPPAPGAPAPNLEVKIELASGSIGETGAALVDRDVYIAPVGQGFVDRIDLAAPVTVTVFSNDPTEILFRDPNTGQNVRSLNVTIPAGVQPTAKVTVVPVNDGEKDGIRGDDEPIAPSVIVLSRGYRATRASLSVVGPDQDIGFTRGMAFARADGLQLVAPSGNVIRDDHFFTLADSSDTAQFEFLSDARISMPGGANISDGTAFEIEITRANVPSTLRFEFDLAGGVAPGSIPISILSTDSASAVASKVIAAMNAQGVALNASGDPGNSSVVVVAGDIDWVELDGTPLVLVNVNAGNRPVFFQNNDFSFDVGRKLAKAISEASQDGAVALGVNYSGTSIVLVGGAQSFSALNSFVASQSLPNSGDSLWGVSSTGAVYNINLFNGLATVVHMEPGVRFAGLSLGPQNLDLDGDGAGGDLSSTLFAITENGNLYAFDIGGIDLENVGDIFSPNFFRTDIWGSTFRSTNLSSVVGLAFSPLDFNLWHPTTVAGIDPVEDAGHGVNPSFDLARPIDGAVTVGGSGASLDVLAAQGALSFRFGLDTSVFTPSTPEGSIPYPQETEFLGTVNEGAQYGILRGNSHLDLVAFRAGLTLDRPAGFLTDIGDNYNLPGGAYGSLVTDPFSLFGYSPSDLPTLYFNYFLEGEGGDPIAREEGIGSATGAGAMRDSARVLVSTDDGQTWQLLATNNNVLDAELPEYLSASAAAPGGDPRQRVQRLFEAENAITFPLPEALDHYWRQGRVDLREFAGASNVRLRFDFSTAGTLPGDDFSGNGAFGNAERGQRNDFRGFFIDDIIVGFAERGEQVTASLNPASPITEFGLLNPLDANSTEFVTAPIPARLPPDQDILVGAYQLEIRRGSLYADPAPGPGNSPNASPAIFSQIDTNDRQADGFTLTLPVISSLRDGDRIIVDDGRQVITFEFTLDGVVQPGNEAIPVLPSPDENALALVVAQKVRSRYPGNTVQVSARAVGGVVDFAGVRSVTAAPALLTDPPPSAAQQALENYLNNGDPFTPPTVPVNEVVRTGYRALNLRMDSQTWRPATDVNPSVWRNWVTLIVPNTVTTETALLLITGSGLSDSPPSLAGEEFDTLAKYAVDTKSVAVILYNVPNQATDILADTRGDHSLTEDSLLASSYDQFLRTGDVNWPVLLPMVKSAVRAMDTTQNYVNNVLNLPVDVQDFVVTGFSKRGWTTYLTGASDPRVKAIMPGVFDALNLFEQLDHHGQTYAEVLDFTSPDPIRPGRRYSDAIQDYVNYQIVDALISPNATIRANAPKLLQIVDPYQYRDKLTLPKYLVNAAGDEFFVNDSSQFYVQNLQGPTYLRMVPNAGHSLGEENVVNIPTARGKTVAQDVKDGFQAFYDAIVNDEPLPNFTWTKGADGSFDLQFDSTRAPSRIVGWTADSDNGDFRWGLGIGPQWRRFVSDGGNPDGADDFATHWSLPRPGTGVRAFLVEVEFDRGPGKLPFVFTTEVSVLRAEALTLRVDQNAGRGDANRFREQGQLLLESNRITFAAEYGIRIEADPRLDDPGSRFINASTGLPAVGTAANLAQLNGQQLATGVSVSNNVVAFSGSGGIRFAGDPNSGQLVDTNGDGTDDAFELDGPVSASMFGRIYNNTLYGNAAPTGVGVEVAGAASPTIMNNVIANFTAGVAVGPSLPNFGTANTVLTANAYQGNGVPATRVNAAGQPAGAVTENFRIALNPADPLFVDGPSGNFSLTSGSRAIDASINALQDRPAMTSITQQLGIPQSPILAPDRDLFGQLRIDEPSVSPFPGLGSNVFKDRGAIERVTGAQAGSLQITDVTLAEGSAGVTQFVFTVTLSAPSSQQVTVTARTANDTAASPGDFTAVNQLLTFVPGETVKTVTVEVNADTQVEPDERFFVDLVSANNAVVAKSRGIGTILNDDVGVPSLTVDDVTQNEGTGGTTPYVFTVSLGAPATGVVTVNYTTKDGTAKAGLDYQANSGQLTFNIGDVTKTVTVNVFADPVNESNENFTVELSGAVGAQISDNVGIGTLINDDTAGSNVIPIGNEFIVNTTHPNNQEQSDVGMDANGNYVVVWTSFNNGLGDIFGRRYLADGTPVGDEFAVNTFTSGDQQTPKIAMEDDGNFVVVWAGAGDGDGSGVFGQRFSSTAGRLGNPFLVNNFTDGRQAEPDVAVNEDGTFIVSWTSFSQGFIFAQRMSAAGLRVGSKVQVSVGQLQDEPSPQIAADSSGNFVVVWGGIDANRFQIFGRGFTSSGQSFGDRFLVNDLTMNEPQVNPSVAAFGSGNFVVAWNSLPTQTDPSDVFARGYQAFSPITPVRRINTTSLGEHSSADVTIDNQGHVAITWTSADQDGDGLGVYGRVFDAAGADLSQGEFLVNTTVVGNQFAPAVALSPLGNGQMVVSWTGESAPGEHLEVYGQRYLVVFDANAAAAPVITAPAAQSINEGQTLSLPISASDPNGDRVRFRLAAGAPAGAAIDPVTGQFTWTKPRFSTQPVPITVIATDDSAGQLSSSTTVLVNVRNVAPSVTVEAPTNVVRDQAVTLLLRGIDPSLDDLAAFLTYQIDWDGNGSVDQTVQARSETTVQRTYTQTGQYNVRVTVLDEAQASSSSDVNVQVTDGFVRAMSDFSSGLDGWTSTGSGTLSHSATGGNTGGYARFTDTPGAGGDGWLVAPAQFLGNWTALDGLGRLAWDHIIASPGDASDFVNASIRISGPGGQATYLGGAHQSVWTTFSAPIESSKWALNSGNWSSLLASITSLEIRIEAVHNNGPTLDVDGIDNVRLMTNNARATSEFSAGLDGWTGTGSGTLTHSANGGNSGGYAQFVDTAGVGGDGWLVAPAKFLGDWSSLNGTGTLAWDHKVVTPGDGAEVLNASARISGPGGQATFNGTLLQSSWTTFYAPIQSSLWTLNSGSWSSLLENVSSLEIRIEGVHNSGASLDQDGVDNVRLVDVLEMPVELGTITSTRIDDAVVSGDGLLYHLTTSRTGQLTIEALYDPALGTPTLRLFNQAGTQLAQATTGNGIRRIDLVTAVGASYFVAVEGSHPSVDLRFTNALSQDGSSVTLFGGAGDDQLRFGVGLLLEATLNGTLYSFPPSFVTSMRFDGGAGNDSMTFQGSTANETVNINPGGATWTPAGNAYTVTAVDMGSILAIGGGGFDTARLFDSAGDDNLTAGETQTTLTGAGFVSTVQDFDRTQAQASAGFDRAVLNDSTGNDDLVMRPDTSQIAGPGFLNSASGFDTVRAQATTGTDKVTFYDSAGNDQLVASPVQAQLSGANFLNTARGFDEVRVLGSNGTDQAQLNDSSGNDQLTIQPNLAQLTGAGFLINVTNFDTVRAIASTGRDTAQLFDTAGADRLLARPGDGYTQITGAGYLGVARGFDEVRAYATAGIDTADLYGLSGADQFQSRADYAQLTGGGFLNYAQGFDTVRGYGNGGLDVANLYGVSGETFEGRAGNSRLNNSFGSRQAFDFDTVRAYAGTGTTLATLFDTALDDHLLSQGNLAMLTGVDYALSVYDFQRVVAKASFGTDTRTVNAHDYLLEQEGNWLDG